MSTAEALAKLIRRRYDMTGSPSRYPMEDSLAEFILEHASEFGIAVIQLPEPEDDGDGQLWFGELRVDTTGRGDRTIHRMFTDLSPAQARDRAADLLAAANAAEQVTA